jgi:hypothetical protein
MMYGISTALLNEKFLGYLIPVCPAFFRQRLQALPALAAGCVDVYPRHAFV